MTPTPIPDTPAPPTGALAQQPLITIGAVTGLIAAAAELLVEFGLSVSPGQEAALEKFIVIAWPFAIVAWGYFKVYSFHTAQKVANDAAVAGAIGAEPPKV